MKDWTTMSLEEKKREALRIVRKRELLKLTAFRNGKAERTRKEEIEIIMESTEENQTALNALLEDPTIPHSSLMLIAYD